MTITTKEAVEADDRIAAIDRLVERLVAQPRDLGEPRCYSCLWSEVVKPHAVEVVGWGRSERDWLQTSEAYDAVCQPWIDALEDADPNLGHGYQLDPSWLNEVNGGKV